MELGRSEGRAPTEIISNRTFTTRIYSASDDKDRDIGTADPAQNESEEVDRKRPLRDHDDGPAFITIRVARPDLFAQSIEPMHNFGAVTVTDSPYHWKGSMKKRAPIVLIAMFAAAAGAIAMAIAFPALFAMACPRCFGFDQISSDVWVHRSSASLGENVPSLIGSARHDLSRFFGPLVSHPRILVCSDDVCFRRLGGGGARAIAVLDIGLLISARGIDPVIFRHELSHAELHARLGIFRTVTKEVPQWFDEGLAVNVSDDLRYLRPEGSVDRCLIEPTGPLPETRTKWTETAENRPMYAEAACLVSRWLNKDAGPRRLRHLIEALASGKSFPSTFASLRDGS
jgi:hypothetical protein